MAMLPESTLDELRRSNHDLLAALLRKSGMSRERLARAIRGIGEEGR